MFSRHHRKARLLFGLSDVVITALAFEAAYQTRVLLPLGFEFYITIPNKALLLGAAVIATLLIGYWLELYDRLDSAHPRVILRDTFRQVVLATICVVLLEFLLRLDLSRGFLLMFAVFNWIGLCVFRWNSGESRRDDTPGVRCTALCHGGGNRGWCSQNRRSAREVGILWSTAAGLS